MVMKFLNKLKILKAVIKCKGHIIFLGLPSHFKTSDAAKLCKLIAKEVNKVKK